MSIKNFKCARCGTCCMWPGYVRLKENEVEEIATFLGISENEFTAKFTELTHDRRNLTLIEKQDGSCIFYDAEEKRCRINVVKPQQCRDFPLRWRFPGWEKECHGTFDRDA